MSDRYNLPAVTATLLNDYVNQCKNLSLILDKYPPETVVAETKNKGPWLQTLVQGNHLDIALTRAAYSRWHAMISAMQVTRFDATLDWRMVIGLGGESVLETDITLHHLYGIPFIPGSALKGLTRAYVTGEIEGYKSDKIDNDNEEVKRIFDIMNPHYPEYYNSLKSSKTTPPTNDQQPNPITFLTVTNTTFTFALALRNPNDLEHKDDLNKTKGWLQEALQKYGVGGKTSAGYGYFRKVDDKDTAPASPASVQTTQKPQTPAVQEKWQRPNIPRFREGQEIQQCFVTQPTDTMRRYYPTAGAFLRYRELPITVAYVVIKEALPEGQQWQLKDSKDRKK